MPGSEAKIRYKVKQGLAFQEVGGSLFIIDAEDPHKRRIHELNDTAAHAFRSIANSSGGLTVDEVALGLQKVYRVDSETANSDAAELLRTLLDLTVLVTQ
ncbi:MAG: PqqD family protein [Planctomycetes bacterium]|nr:PqqD family protein [Planctomycetota bacterium]